MTLIWTGETDGPDWVQARLMALIGYGAVLGEPDITTGQL